MDTCGIALRWKPQHTFDDEQAITWANIDPDLCRHMASLDQNE